MKTLAKGTRYDWKAMTFTGWTGGEDGYEGYRVEEYFGGDGEYKGADAYGVEPTFAD